MSKSKKKGLSIEEFAKQNGRSTDPVPPPVKNFAAQNERPSIPVPGSIYLPADTIKVLTRERVENFSLKFNKFARYDGEKFSFYKADKGKSVFNDVENYPFNGIKFSLLTQEIQKSAEVLFPEFYATFALVIDWRLTIGLGTESVYETSINLHPVYGFPYIPGQSLKGITRSWIITENFNGDEKAAYQNETFCYLLGCPKESVLKKEHQGSLVFFDAYPTEKPTLKVDVMNPHYSEYYSDSKNTKPPADYYNPVPIFFLTVENTSFQFLLGIRNQDNKSGNDFKTNSASSFFDLGKKYLLEALKQKGVGAKTSVGYGYFK